MNHIYLVTSRDGSLDHPHKNTRTRRERPEGTDSARQGAAGGLSLREEDMRGRAVRRRDLCRSDSTLYAHLLCLSAVLLS